MSNKQEMQDLLTRSVNHIRRQGKPAGYVNGCFFICEYHAQDGSSCAAAPFISSYTQALEKKGFGDLVQLFPEQLDPIAVKHVNLVRAMQSAHDQVAEYDASPAAFLREFENRMAYVAQRFGLIVPPPIAMGARTY